MPESSPYPSLVVLPSTPRRTRNDASDVTKITIWAADLQRALSKHFNDISKPLREGTLAPGPHASSHFPQNGIDPLATAAPNGGYAATATMGVADSLLRSDAVLVYPEALGTLADRTKKFTLTSASGTPTLTFTGAWTGDFFNVLYAIKAPSYQATNENVVCLTPGKGHVSKDTQGTPRYWAFYNEATGVGSGTIDIDPWGALTITRTVSSGIPTGSAQLVTKDLGVSVPGP